MRIVDIEPVIESLRMYIACCKVNNARPVVAETILTQIKELPVLEEEDNIKKLKEVNKCLDKANISLLTTINQLMTTINQSMTNSAELENIIKHYGAKNEKN